MSVEIEDLVIAARIDDGDAPALDPETIDRLRAEILAACLDEVARALQRLTER